MPLSDMIHRTALAHGLDPQAFHQSVMTDPTIGPHITAAQGYLQQLAGAGQGAPGAAPAPGMVQSAPGAPPAGLAPMAQFGQMATPGAPGGGMLSPAYQPMPQSQQTANQQMVGQIAQGGMADRGTLATLLGGMPGATGGVPMVRPAPVPPR